MNKHYDKKVQILNILKFEIVILILLKLYIEIILLIL